MDIIEDEDNSIELIEIENTKERSKKERMLNRRLQVLLSPEDSDMLDAIAKETRRSKNSVIRVLIKEGFDKYVKKEEREVA